ncbi:DNA methyltransferase [Candidatus Spongiihabitans sp.]|uniref:DNA methyltransferase n=1 Tax=Candidatus Spongiihabitans sp. TaxID=3101308 RepID=UPI003C6FBF15
MQPQVHNRTIFTGDNLPILRGMNTESVDLVYLDPPFNSNRNYEAPVGSKAAHKIEKGDYDKIVYRHGKTEVALNDWWHISILNSQSKERTGYPTQKPMALLDRIIKASCPQGGLVLDSFCGCATTCVAAEKYGRQWIGIDISAKAVELVRTRLHKDLGIVTADDKKTTVWDAKVIHRTDIPKRSARGLARSHNIKNILYGQQEGFCSGCRTHFPMRNMEVDHIVPKAHGGQDTDDNLQLLCGACNRTKGIGTMADLMARLPTQVVARI